MVLCLKDLCTLETVCLPTGDLAVGHIQEAHHDLGLGRDLDHGHVLILQGGVFAGIDEAGENPVLAC